MPRPKKYVSPKRINLLLEASVHQFATDRARAFNLSGGFSEYVARLIAQDSKRKGRALAKEVAA